MQEEIDVTLDLSFFDRSNLKNKEKSNQVIKKTKKQAFLATINYFFKKVKKNKDAYPLSPELFISPEILMLNKEVDNMLENNELDKIAILMKNGYRFNKEQENVFVNHFIERYCEKKSHTLDVNKKNFMLFSNLKKEGFIYPEKVWLILLFSFTTLNSGCVYLKSCGKYPTKDSKLWENIDKLTFETVKSMYQNKEEIDYLDMIDEFYHQPGNDLKLYKIWKHLSQNNLIDAMSQSYYIKLFLVYFLKENPKFIREAQNILLNNSIKNNALLEYSNEALHESMLNLSKLSPLAINLESELFDEKMKHLINIVKKTSTNEGNDEEIKKQANLTIETKELPKNIKDKLDSIKKIFENLLLNKEKFSTEDWTMIESVYHQRLTEIIKTYRSLNSYQENDPNYQEQVLISFENINEFMKEKDKYIQEIHEKNLKVLVRYTSQIKPK